MTLWTRSREDGLMIPVTGRNELAGGARIGGKIVGPRTETSGIWNGRPPVAIDGAGPMTLSLAARPGEGTPGQTVTIDGDFGNGFGGSIRRRFNVGGGLSASLRVGNFEHVQIRVVPDPLAAAGNVGIPSGMTVFFCWTWELQPSAKLLLFENYPVGGVTIEAPEGCESIYVESACTLTFAMTQFGNTFARAVVAGERVPCLWGAFSCNIPNKFVFESRGV